MLAELVVGEPGPIVERVATPVTAEAPAVGGSGCCRELC
jgi:hypothetical protein